MSRMLMLYNWLLAPLPGARLMRFRIWWLKRCGITIGTNVSIAPNVYFDVQCANMTICDYVRIEPYARFILRDGTVKIGTGSIISSFVRFNVTGNVDIGNQVTIRELSLIHVIGNSVQIGDNVCIAENVILESIRSDAEGGILKVGSNVDVMQYTFLSANGKSKVTIGDDCKIAHNVSIKATHHRIDASKNCIGDTSLFDDISIGTGCWICAGAIIIPGVKVGIKNVIGAGAVVIENTNDYSLMVGVPAIAKSLYIEDPKVAIIPGGGNFVVL